MALNERSVNSLTVNGGPSASLGPSYPNGSAALQSLYNSAWLTTWSAQSSSRIATTTLRTGSQPQPTSQLASVFAQSAIVWQTTWGSQRGATIAPLSLVYGNRPQDPNASPDQKARYALAWQSTWSAQQEPPFTPGTGVVQRIAVMAAHSPTVAVRGVMVTPGAGAVLAGTTVTGAGTVFISGAQVTQVGNENAFTVTDDVRLDQVGQSEAFTVTDDVRLDQVGQVVVYRLPTGAAPLRVEIII